MSDLINSYSNSVCDSVSDDEPILFMDAVHPTQATKVSSFQGGERQSD